MEDEEFHGKVDKMFESRLERHIVRIKDLENNKILTEDDMDYNLVLFDTNLNIYKIKEGVPHRVDNSNFKAIML